MPVCGNCGGFVTEAYERVFKPDDLDQVRCCTDCDVVRDGNETREMRSRNGRTTEPSSYDPNYSGASSDD